MGKGNSFISSQLAFRSADKYLKVLRSCWDACQFLPESEREKAIRNKSKGRIERKTVGNKEKGSWVLQNISGMAEVTQRVSVNLCVAVRRWAGSFSLFEKFGRQAGLQANRVKSPRKRLLCMILITKTKQV